MDGNFAEIVKAILFGMLEGITEWLPISSTGHLILLNEFVRLDAGESYWNMFKVVIQLGAILAVVVIFWKRIFPFGKHDNPHPLAQQGPLSYVKTDIFIMWFKILAACIPAVLAMPFEELFEKWFSNEQTVAAALIVFGIAFILIENGRRGKTEPQDSLSDVTYGLAFIIGIFQLIAAVFPGTSRSGATIAGALLLGLSRKTAAEFTFFLAIPVMFGASLLKLLQFGMNFSNREAAVLVTGMVTAFLVSVIVIRFFMAYIKKHDFKTFGWYRIVLGILVFVMFTFK